MPTISYSVCTQITETEGLIQSLYIPKAFIVLLNLSKRSENGMHINILPRHTTLDKCSQKEESAKEKFDWPFGIRVKHCC